MFTLTFFLIMSLLSSFATISLIFLPDPVSGGVAGRQMERDWHIKDDRPMSGGCVWSCMTVDCLMMVCVLSL